MALTGFEPMASALALQWSTNWAICWEKTHMLGADQFIEFIFTRDRNPIKALNLFFRATICNCLSCKYNRDDHISFQK